MKARALITPLPFLTFFFFLSSTAFGFGYGGSTDSCIDIFLPKTKTKAATRLVTWSCSFLYQEKPETQFPASLREFLCQDKGDPVCGLTDLPTDEMIRGLYLDIGFETGKSLEEFSRSLKSVIYDQQNKKLEEWKRNRKYAKCVLGDEDIYTAETDYTAKYLNAKRCSEK